MEGTKCRMQCLLQSVAWSGGSDEAGSFPLPDCIPSLALSAAHRSVSAAGLRDPQEIPCFWDPSRLAQ